MVVQNDLLVVEEGVHHLEEVVVALLNEGNNLPGTVELDQKCLRRRQEL